MGSSLAREAYSLTVQRWKQAWGLMAAQRPQWPEWKDVLDDGRKGWVIKSR